MSKKNTYIISKRALFSVIATILSFIKIPLFFIPSFYKLEFSDALTLMSSLFLDPLLGVLVLLFKNILLIFLKGSQSFFIGEIANFILGLFFILPCSIVYKKNKTFRGLLWGLVLGLVLEGLASIFFNIYVFLPLYSKFLFIPIGDLIKVTSVINPFIKNYFTFIIFAIFPFNLLKYSCVCLFTVIIYKKLTFFVDNIFN